MTTKTSLHYPYTLLLMVWGVLNLASVATAVGIESNPNRLRFDLDEWDLSLPPEEIRTHYSRFPGQRFYSPVSWSGSEMGSPEHWEKTTWSSQGKNIYNTRRVLHSDISSNTLNLTQTPAFQFVLNHSTSATPAIIGSSIIVPSWDGSLRSIHRLTGRLQWMVDIGMSYFGSNVTGTKICRTTPTFVPGGYYFIVGTQFPAELLFIRTQDGYLISNTTLDDHPLSVVTMSGTVSDNVYYTGVSSREEFAAGNNSYPCCNFTGSMVAVDISTGNILWKTYSISENIRGLGKFSGAALWGSSPSVWKSRGLVFAATGNNYASPEGYNLCLEEYATSYCNSLFFGEKEEYNYMNSVIAYDVNTGKIVWVRQMSARDVWNIACIIPNSTNCPQSPGSNSDFGMAPAFDWWCYYEPIEDEYSPRVVSEDGTRGIVPNLPFIKANSTLQGDDLTRVRYNETHNKVCIRALYIGQKSGAAYCLRASTGAIIWSKQVTPGGLHGGISWGLALDEDRVYFACVNSGRIPWLLLNGTRINCGGWAACDKYSGNIVWTTADPGCFVSLNGRARLAGGSGPPTVINDIVLVGSKDTIYNSTTNLPVYGGGGGGWVYALNVTTGKILSSHQTKAAINGGFSANKDCVYIGNGGYPTILGGSNGTSIFAWCTSESLNQYS